MSIISERINGKIIEVDISSSNIIGATYDTDSKKLEIRFVSGGIYEYEDVPWELFTKFRLSESQGKFFNTNISKSYKYKKIK